MTRKKIFLRGAFSLTLPGLGFFENRRVGVGCGGGGCASRPALKKHAVSQKIFVHFTWNFVHILFWQYGISLDKKLTNVTFIIIWWRHHESHVLTFFKVFLGINVFLLVNWVCKIHRKQVAEINSQKAKNYFAIQKNIPKNKPFRPLHQNI